MKSNDSVGIFINISFKDRLLINIYEFCGGLMEQPTWHWICFDFCVRFTPYFEQNINVTILE